MQLAILHYHLNRGGVTQAIINHLESLATCDAADQPDRVALIYSGKQEGWPTGEWRNQLPFECQMVVVPALAYDTTVGTEPDMLADAIAHGLKEAGFDLSTTLLHSHNHSLGKNASLPGALALLAQRGCRLLMQVHDFAEDFRPANYRHLTRSLRARSAEELAATLYPQGSAIHYATLTGRDYGLLSRGGVADERLHVLPNPVGEFEGLPSPEKVRGPVRDRLNLNEDARLIVYPVRGIRRKNVGEMLLYNALAGRESCYGVTLAPQNPAELASFDRWNDLSDRFRLGCLFDLVGSEGVEFKDVLAAADAVITTSLAEGFGMVFLEAWLAGKPLVGRNLPEITQDFVASGVQFPGLRDQLRVPLKWLNVDQLRSQILELHNWACRDYNVTPPAEAGQQLEKVLNAGSIDFGALPTLSQVEAISAAAMDRDAAMAAIVEYNEGFDPEVVLAGSGQSEIIQSNAQRVREAYSPKTVGRRLSDIYRAVMQDDPSSETEPPAAGESILHSFLQIQRLCPVRIEA